MIALAGLFVIFINYTSVWTAFKYSRGQSIGIITIPLLGPMLIFWSGVLVDYSAWMVAAVIDPGSWHLVLIGRWAVTNRS